MSVYADQRRAFTFEDRSARAVAEALGISVGSAHEMLGAPAEAA